MKRIFLSLVCISLAGAVSAQTLGFLHINPDAATAGMAGAGVALKGGAYASANNVAAIALQDNTLDVGAGYGLWMPQVSKNNMISVSGYYKIGEKLGVEAAFKNFSHPSYAITSSDGRAQGSFTPKEFDLGAGAAYRIMDGLSAGVHLRLASSALGEGAKATFFGADLALKYEKDAFQAGFSANNIGGKVNYGTSSESMPLLVKGGAAYTVAGLTASLEADYVGGGIMASLGASYHILDIVSVRAGYHYGDSRKNIPSFASAGVGACFSGVHLDFAYLLASENLGGSLMLTLGYRF